MFIAMNRFRINPGKQEDFENIWRARESHLHEMAGFKSFNLLKGALDETTGITLYASHTVWEDRASFAAWTNSQQFRDAHKNAGAHNGIHAGHPQFEGFEAVEGVA